MNHEAVDIPDDKPPSDTTGRSGGGDPAAHRDGRPPGLNQSDSFSRGFRLLDARRIHIEGAVDGGDEEQLRADGGRPTEEEMLDDALFVERDEEPRLPTHTNAEEFRASFERARDPSATARRERAYKFGQAQRARSIRTSPDLNQHAGTTTLECWLSREAPR